MRVLHVSQPVDAGVAAVVMALVEDQLHRGWEPQVACPGSGWLPGAVRDVGATARAWSAGRSPGPATARETLTLRRIVADVDPDVVHLHGSKAGLAGRLAIRRSRPTLFEPHLWSFRSDSSLAGRAALYWERFATRWTDRIICVSDDELHDGREHGVRGTATVIPNGIDVDRLRPEDAGIAKKELGFGPAPVVTCVGRLAPLKGQDLLLDAWGDIVAAVPDARLVLVGDGPDRDRLHAHPAASAESVHWAGHRDDADRFLAAADVVAVPSRAEGMALVPLEAMALGRSVVAYDVGGIRQSVADTGAVLPVGDVGALSAAIVARLTDARLRATEGAMARRRAETLFSRRRMADEVATVVGEVARRD